MTQPDSRPPTPPALQSADPLIQQLDLAFREVRKRAEACEREVRKLLADDAVTANNFEELRGVTKSFDDRIKHVEQQVKVAINVGIQHENSMTELRTELKALRRSNEDMAKALAAGVNEKIANFKIELATSMADSSLAEDPEKQLRNLFDKLEERINARTLNESAAFSLQAARLEEALQEARERIDGLENQVEIRRMFREDPARQTPSPSATTAATSHDASKPFAELLQEIVAMKKSELAHQERMQETLTSIVNNSLNSSPGRSDNVLTNPKLDDKGEPIVEEAHKKAQRDWSTYDSHYFAVRLHERIRTHHGRPLTFYHQRAAFRQIEDD
jgi:hypothetical protein